jgi:hypothetical protein
MEFGEGGCELCYMQGRNFAVENGDESSSPLPSPVTSCEAERSFSSLRRLKTWIRSTVSQEHVNSVAVCNAITNTLTS